MVPRQSSKHMSIFIYRCQSVGRAVPPKIAVEGYSINSAKLLLSKKELDDFFNDASNNQNGNFSPLIKALMQISIRLNRKCLKGFQIVLNSMSKRLK